MAVTSGEFLLYIDKGLREGFTDRRTERMRALVADDEAVVRSALRLFLEQHFGAQVLSEAWEAGELLAGVERSCPDLLLLDWGLPRLDAIEMLPVMRGRCPNMKIVVLNGRPEARRAALEGGADAFVSKGGSPEELLAALGSLEGLSLRHRQAGDAGGDPGDGEMGSETLSK
jgi:CheY-like chemotaxis protein